MKYVIIACTVFALTAPAAIAGERENAMHHIAEVFAVGKLCSKLELNKAMIALVAMRFDVDFIRDKDELTEQVVDQMAPWKDQPEAAACIAGVYLYGPNGANVPNLVREK